MILNFRKKINSRFVLRAYHLRGTSFVLKRIFKAESEAKDEQWAEKVGADR